MSLFTARAALFDMDGTLVDSEPIYYEAYRLAIESTGVTYSPEFHVEHLLGRPEKVGSQACVDLLSLSITATELLRLRDEHVEPAFALALPCAGAEAVVSSLCAALPANRMAIATSSKLKLVEIKRRSGRVDKLLSRFGEAIVCSDSPSMIGRNGKPSPDIFLTAAAALGVSASECIAFEDSLAGIEAAAAAGCFVIAIPDSRLPEGSALKAGANIVLRSLEDFSLDLVGLGGEGAR
jgi:beta-phosphoglucomutase-like phosphatase (HAD superfamily)